MNIKIVFDDNTSKTINYSGDSSFPDWCMEFFKMRYFCINRSNDIGNMTVDTYKVKYVERF